jgi:lysozyme family protein
MATNPYYTANRISSYEQKFDTSIVKDTFKVEANNFISKMLANKSIYTSIEASTGVPWFFIAALHMRESSMRFDRHLHNGDPLTARTKLVPSGYPKAAPANGRVYTFAESATDALRIKNLQNWKDWTIGGMAYVAEMYNGAGYINRGVNNPYLWSGTNHYVSGKYIADGKFSSTAIDKQIGVMTLVKQFLNAYPQYNSTVSVKKKSNNLASTAYHNSGLSFFMDFFKS